MSHLLIEQKRARLKNEIEIAQTHLYENIEKIHASDYLPSPKELIPEIASSLFTIPKNFISQVDRITKNILPNNNIIRSFFNLLNILIGK